MLFAIFVLLSAFLIEGIGTYVSVIGLSSLFAANPIIITLAVALDIGKIAAVSFLYKHWQKIGWLMKSYMTIASAVLMIITSAGAFGFLSGEFQKAISNTNQQSVILAALTEEQGRLQTRKDAIDKQIAQLPENMVRGRTTLIKQFAPEVGRINTRLAEIDKELPKLKVENIQKNVEVGPIIYIAEAFNTTPEQAVKWVILIIIFVFDPLAIALLLAGNFLIDQIRKSKTLDEQLIKFDPEKHGGEVGLNPPLIDEVKPESLDTIQTSIQPEETVNILTESPTELRAILEHPIVDQIVKEEHEDVVEPIFTVLEPSPKVDEELVGELKPLLINRPDQDVLKPIEQVLTAGARDVITLNQVRTHPPPRSSLEKIDGHADVDVGGEIVRSSILGTYQNNR